jgi:hypothetical protein
LLIPHFLAEKGSRTALQNLYVGIVGSDHNARMLAENSIQEIDLNEFRGNTLTRNCMAAALSWLKIYRKFPLIDTIFNQQILLTVKTIGDEFKIDFTKDSKIEKIDNRTVRISDKHHSVNIQVNYKKKAATLTMIMEEHMI